MRTNSEKKAARAAWYVAACVGVACVFARPCVAMAQAPSILSDRRDDAPATGTVGIDLSIARVMDNSLTGLTPLAFGAWYLSDHARFDFACALPGGLFPDQGESYFKPGNPMLALHWYTVQRSFAARVGGSVSFPVATVPGTTGAVDDGSGGREAQVHRVAAQSRGGWDAMLVQPATLAFGVPVHVETLSSHFSLGIDAGAFVWICTVTEQCSSTRLSVQGAIDGALLTGIVRLGLRGQAVGSSRRSVDDTQISLEPYIEAKLGINVLRLSVLVNLDAPAGFSFAANGVWATHLGLRATM